MFYLIAAIVWFLHAFGVLDDTENVVWLYVGLGFFALGFWWNPWPIVPPTWSGPPKRQQ